MESGERIGINDGPEKGSRRSESENLSLGDEVGALFEFRQDIAIGDVIGL